MSNETPIYSVRSRRLLVNASSPREAMEVVLLSEGDLDFSMVPRLDVTKDEQEEIMAGALTVQDLADTDNPGTYEVVVVRMAEINDQGNEINAWVDIEELGPRLPFAIHVDLSSNSPRYVAAVEAKRLDKTLAADPSTANAPRPARF